MTDGVMVEETPGREEKIGGRPGSRLRAALGWLLAVPGTVWLAMRLAGPESGHLVQLVAFTPYAAAGATVAALLASGLRSRWPAAVAAIAALGLLGLVAPRAVPGADPAATGPRLRVLTANVLAGAADPATVVDLVRTHRVDVLAVQEFTPATAAALDRLGLAELLPYRQLNPEDGTSGSALYAGQPIDGGGTRRNSGGFSQAYGAMRVPGADPVLVESVHPAAPWAPWVIPDWRRDLAAQPPATPGGPVRILAGDFNATLDHAPLQALLDTGYADAADQAGAGLVGTWGPYDGDRIPPVVIDHVLVDRRVGVRSVSVHRLPGGDHRAVLADLVLPATGR